MDVETKVKRIGGSMFALIPPDVVRELKLEADTPVVLDVRKRGGTAKDLLALRGKYKGFPSLGIDDAGA